MELLQVLQDKNFATINPLLKGNDYYVYTVEILTLTLDCNNWIVRKIIEGLCDELMKACQVDNDSKKKKTRTKKKKEDGKSEHTNNNENDIDDNVNSNASSSGIMLGLMSYLGISSNDNDTNVNIETLVIDMNNSGSSDNNDFVLAADSDENDDLDEFWNGPQM